MKPRSLGFRRLPEGIVNEAGTLLAGVFEADETILSGLATGKKGRGVVT